MARPVLMFRVVMKDIIYVGIILAFFCASWVYAKSFDRL